VTLSGVTLVTGAAGFLGRHLVEHLVRGGATVRAVVRPAESAGGLDRCGVEVVRADLTVPETLPPLFAGSVGRVFHLAGICNFSTPYEVLARVNVDGVERMTALARRAGVGVFVHMSSSGVYGAYRGKPFVEDAQRVPQDDYGRSKRDGEDVVWQRIREGLPGIVVRPCTVYGPGCSDGAGKVFSRRAKLGAIPGNGRQRLANVRVEDVAAASVHLSSHKDALGRAFNVVDDSQPTLEEALTLAAEAFGAKPPRIHVPIAVVAMAARVSALGARMTGRIPDLESDAVRYLRSDYALDNARLKATGYRLRYPGFTESMREIGRRFRDGTLCG
jgi:nucleoside-diphosphate-sugar epimerase